MTKEKALEIIEELRDKVEAFPRAYDLLNSLTDRELTAVLALDTHNFGRSWANSLANAKLHLENREVAIKLFSRMDNKL